MQLIAGLFFFPWRAISFVVNATTRLLQVVLVGVFWVCVACGLYWWLLRGDTA